MDFGNYLASSSDEEGVWSAEGATNDTSDKYRVIFITKLQSSYSQNHVQNALITYIVMCRYATMGFNHHTSCNTLPWYM